MTNIISIDGTSLSSQVAPTVGGYVALGVDGTKSVIFSLFDKKVHFLKPSDYKEIALKSILGLQWCSEKYDYFDEKKESYVFDTRSLTSDIMLECQNKGPYSAIAERGTGVWLDESGELLVNSRELWRADGTVLEHGFHGGKAYPFCGEVGFDATTPEASEEEVQRVLTALNGPGWAQPLAAELLLAFIGVSVLSTALRRRPHVLLTGPAGAGKSAVLETVRWLLGDLAAGFTGPQTMAALYQQLGGTSKAAILDEFEADPARKASKDVLEVARMSYSLQENDSGIVRGTVSGKAKSYRFFAPFLAAGISPGRMEPADLTRWVTLEVKAKARGASFTEAQAREIGPKLCRLIINRWGVFQSSEKVVRKSITESGGDSRMADTVGTLLAMYWAFVSKTPATEDDAAVLVGMFGMEERIAQHAVSDELQCLEALTSRVLPFKLVSGPDVITRSLSIGEAIEQVCKDPSGQPYLIARLAQLGMRVSQSKGKWSLYVACSHAHAELRKLFGGTKWSQGGWSVVLRRLPGGEESTQRIGAGLGAAKVVVIDVPQYLLPANDECADMLLAA